MPQIHIFVSFLLSLLESTVMAKSIIRWIDDDRTIFKIFNRNLLAQYWTFINKPKNKEKLSKTPSMDWDKIRRNLLELDKLGVIKDKNHDTYEFLHKDVKYEFKELEFPFNQYEIKYVKDVEPDDSINVRFDRIETAH